MHRTATLLGILLLYAACSAPEPQPEPFDATVTFSLTPAGLIALTPAGDTGQRLVITREATVFLAVAKADRKPLIDAWAEDAGEHERYGRHRFPPGCTAAAIAGYYRGVLGSAGWKKGLDYRVDDGRIAFFGVTRLTSGADSNEIQADVESVRGR